MKDNQHLSTESLLAVMYETAGEPELVHARTCPECRRQLEALEDKRAMSAETALSGPQLARQRSAIYSRLDSRPAGWYWTWAAVPLAAAAALVMMVNVGGVVDTDGETKVASSQTRPAGAAVGAIGNDTLYSDIYQSLSVQTPAGVYAAVGVFDEQTAVEVKN